MRRQDKIPKALNVEGHTVYGLCRKVKKKLDGELPDDVLIGYKQLTKDIADPARRPFS